jgi:hypothetical protein
MPVQAGYQKLQSVAQSAATVPSVLPGANTPTTPTAPSEPSFLSSILGAIPQITKALPGIMDSVGGLFGSGAGATAESAIPLATAGSSEAAVGALAEAAPLLLL